LFYEYDRFENGGWCVRRWGNLDRIGDFLRAPGNFARAQNGRPFLMQVGRNDWFCTVEQAQRLYDIIPGSKAAK